MKSGRQSYRLDSPEKMSAPPIPRVGSRVSALAYFTILLLLLLRSSSLLLKQAAYEIACRAVAAMTLCVSVGVVIESYINI